MSVLFTIQPVHQGSCNKRLRSDVEEDAQEVSDRFVNSEFVITGYMNSRKGRMKTNLLHVRDSFEMVSRGKERGSGD
jgi:hypothetical protein